MFKEVVSVVDIFGDKVAVKLRRKEACSCCRAASFCHNKEQDTLLIDGGGLLLQKGDRIEVGIEERKTFLASIITFLVPLLVFISGILLLRKLGEFVSFLLAVSVVIIYYLLIRTISRKKGRYFNLRVIRKL